MSGPESILIQNCLTMLNQYSSGFLEKIDQKRAKGAGSAVGAPDAILSRKGTLYALEFKSKDGRLSKGQRIAIHCRWQERVPTYVIASEQEFADLLCGRLARYEVEW